MGSNLRSAADERCHETATHVKTPSRWKGLHGLALSSFLLLGAGCAVTHYPLETDELGHAAICIWNEKKEPTHCVYDKTRYTIDIEAYEQLQDRLARQKRELYDKRRL